jgi:nitrate reductase gamma subunit
MRSIDQILGIVVGVLFLVGIVLMIQRRRLKTKTREQWNDLRMK